MRKETRTPDCTHLPFKALIMIDDTDVDTAMMEKLESRSGSVHYSIGTEQTLNEIPPEARPKLPEYN